MKELDYTGSFKRDLKRITKRRYDLSKLSTITDALQDELPLPQTARPHPLKGRWIGYLECHIAPDWLLIYRNTPTHVVLVRTGTHSDLFDE